MTLADVKEQLALRAVQAHLSVLRARSGLGLLQQQQAKIEDYLARIKGAVDDGAVDEAEYQMARDIAVALEGYIADYQGELNAAYAQYFEATGQTPPKEMTRPVLNLSEIPETMRDAIVIAEDSHPSIRSASYQAKSAEYAIDAEEALLYPDVNGELSYLESDREEELGGEVTDARAIVRMSWDFETGGAQLARIRKKKLWRLKSRRACRSKAICVWLTPNLKPHKSVWKTKKSVKN